MPQTTAQPACYHTKSSSVIGQPKLPREDITNDDLGAYDKQINALMRQVHQHIALANNEADHKMNTKSNWLVYKDSIQVEDKFILHRPQSAITLSSCSSWVSNFGIIMANDIVLQGKKRKWRNQLGPSCSCPSPHTMMESFEIHKLPPSFAFAECLTSIEIATSSTISVAYKDTRLQTQ